MAITLIVKPRAVLGRDIEDFWIRGEDCPDQIPALTRIVIDMLGAQLLDDVVHLTVLPAKRNG